jgi:transposase InsO family protein
MRAARAYKIEIPACSEKTIKRHFDKKFDAETQCRERLGLNAWEAKFWASLKRDRSPYHALEILNGDGHKLDFNVLLPSGKEGRVMATFWMDLSSNFLFPPQIDVSENTDTIRKSFLQICEQYGVPKCVNIDNGMGYSGKDLSG